MSDREAPHLSMNPSAVEEARRGEAHDGAPGGASPPAVPFAWRPVLVIAADEMGIAAAHAIDRPDGGRVVGDDIADDLHKGETLNYSLRHFLKRIKIYESEEFMYKLVKMPLDMRIKRPKGNP